MRILIFFITILFVSEISLAFDLKKLGDSLQKDLGGALKELDKSLKTQDNTLNNSKPKLEQKSPQIQSALGQATAKIENGLCVITYTATDGSKHVEKSGMPDCDQRKRDYLVLNAKDIEKRIKSNQAIRERNAENAKKRADIKEKENNKINNEKQKKLAEVRAKQSTIRKSSSPLDPSKLIPKDKETKKFVRDYPKSQKLFLAEFWEYRSLMTKYYESKFDANVSEREGDKALNLAYDKFVLKFYKDEGKRQETGDGNSLKEYPFPLSALHFSYSDNIGQSINDWKCYVPPRHPDTGKQSICEIVWETTLRGEKTMVNIPVLVDVRGYGDFHESVIGKNPKRYVGDQLSLSASDFWLFGEVMGADNDLGWDSTLLTMVVVDPTWKISIEDAVKYDPKKKKWVFR